jgi:RNA:NAD 2'-phosphotransferase (TPT1/KptA family)
MKTIEIYGKRIAYILRHDPGKLKMDDQGYVDVDELLGVLKTSKDNSTN